jgi:predicted alpha/beta superfamily hydrolase
MQRIIRLALVVVTLVVCACTEQQLTGNIQYLRDVHSTYTTYDRDVIIYLPPNYDKDPNAHYPVLYMHDGEHLMDATTGGGQEWGVDETAERMILAGDIEPLIIVGVYSAGVDSSQRVFDYTPVPQANSGGGGADAYGNFLTLELKPMIDAQFRTQSDRSGIAGSSLGGLVSMYFGLTRSETFSRAGVMSPTVSWANNDIVDRVHNLPGKLPLVIWEDEGTAEGSAPQRNLDATRSLRDSLTSKGWTLGHDLDFAYAEIPGGEHDVSDWSARFDRVLRYLYPPTRP